MGISLRPYLGYTPAWAARGGKDDHAWNDPPRSEQDWVRFTGAVAGRLRPYRSIVSYEIYNEENTALWWEGSAEEYARVLRAGADAIRRADPDAQILLGGLVGPISNGSSRRVRADARPSTYSRSTPTPRPGLPIR